MPAWQAGRTMIRVVRQTGVPAGYHEVKGIFQLCQNVTLFKGASGLLHLGGYFFDGLVLGGRGAFGSSAHGLVRFWLIKLLDQSGPFLLRSLGNGRNGFVGGFELAGEDGLPCSGNSLLCDIHTFGKGFCTEYRASAHAILRCDAVASGAAGPFQLFILNNWWVQRRGNAARVCAAAGEFFGLILFAQDIIALLWRQVAAAQLVFADPDDRLWRFAKSFSRMVYWISGCCLKIA